MQARDIMTSPAITVTPDTEIHEIAKLLLERRISAVPVVDAGGQAIGIVSEGDLMRRGESEDGHQRSWWLTLFSAPEDRARRYVKSHGRFAHEVMTRPVVTADETTPTTEIAATLERQRIKRVVVVRDGKVTGIVSRANLLHGLASQPVPTRTAGGTDEELRAQLQAALREAGVRSSLVNVIVNGGVADLWGAVESIEEKQAARVAAENLPGIREIKNHISVLPKVVTSLFGAE